MRDRSHHPSLYAIIFFVAAAALGLCSIGATSTREAAAASDPVRELLEKRLTVVTKIHEWALKQYETGMDGDYLDVLESRLVVLDARLEMCRTKAERVAVLQETVETREKMLELVKTRASAATASQIDVLKAEVSLIEAQIGVEKAKASE